MPFRRSYHPKPGANGSNGAVSRRQVRGEVSRLAPRFLVRLVGKAKAECLCNDGRVFLRHD